MWRTTVAAVAALAAGSIGYPPNASATQPHPASDPAAIHAADLQQAAETAQGSVLRPGHVLSPGQYLLSPNKRYALNQQPDGNLVLYQGTGPHARPLWSSHTDHHPGARLTVQRDGNAVIYTRANQPLWSSHTDHHAGARLELQEDGNAVVYSPSNQALWSSHTSH